ncbi:MAG: response regulator transcription factor [Anaerolineales bacterium]|nr:response regulator transcription factor [Anaerolineales bacterium]
MIQNDELSKKWRILIADDVHETRRSTRLMLSTLDNVEVVAIASNGVEAVEMAKEHRPDIVVMDINMPEMDGLTAYKLISKMYPDTACIVISAESDLRTLNAAESLGVQAYLTKPFIIEELETAVKYVAAGLDELRAKNPQLDLERLAVEYSKARRADEQSARVFERLAQNPQCNIRWLKTLAMIYILRQEWGKLKSLAERLERGNG